MQCCTGFDRDGVPFLHSSRCGTVVWICAGCSADNSEVFLSLLSRVNPELSLLCSSAHPSSERLGVHKELGGDTARTADPNWPRVTLYHMELYSVTVGKLLCFISYYIPFSTYYPVEIIQDKLRISNFTNTDFASSITFLKLFKKAMLGCIKSNSSVKCSSF